MIKTLKELDLGFSVVKNSDRFELRLYKQNEKGPFKTIQGTIDQLPNILPNLDEVFKSESMADRNKIMQINTEYLT